MSKRNFPPTAARFIHFRDVSTTLDGHAEKTVVGPNGGVTLAFIDDVKDDKPVVYCGLAYCHSGDRYNKKMGRIKAAGRMMQNAAHGGNIEGAMYMGGEKYITSEPGDDIGAFIRQVIDYIEQEQGYYRVRPAT